MARSFTDIMREIRASIREITPGEAAAIREQSPQTAFVDVREQTEWDEGYIPGAIHVPRGHLESRIESALPDHDQPILLYCAAGTRSALAAMTMLQMGYSNVTNMSGGFQQWKTMGLPWQLPPKLTAEQKAAVGKALNAAKQSLESAFESKNQAFSTAALKSRLDAEWVDLTTPLHRRYRRGG